jgi:anion-transporting  ArsA/GET3 family ATPase
LRKNGQPVSGELHAMMLDVQNTFDQLVERHTFVGEHRDAILNNRMYRNIVTRLTGSQEYASMQRLHDIVKEGAYDRIILDTPPASHALEFLSAPQRLSDFFDSRMLQIFVNLTEKATWNLLRPGSQLFLKALEKLSGSGLISEIAEFFRLIEPLLASFRDEPALAKALLTSNSTGFLVVSGAQPLELAQAVDFHATLQKLNFQVDGLIVNRVLPELVESEQPLPDGDDAEDPLAREILVWCARLERLARLQADAIRTVSHAQQIPCLTVPVWHGQAEALSGLRYMASFLN